MRVNEDYHTWNASLQTPDDRSVFSYWKHVLQLRKLYKDVLIYGDFEMLAKEDKEVVVYRRAYERQQALVVLNFTERTVRWTPPQGRKEIIELVKEQWRRLGNYEELKMEGGAMVLRPFEAAMFVE
jgi:oligo-1,6-glucosidase